ncbi:hypothetical protein N7456_010798 [Penicillium angulare]|uniref:Xylanolytic transcriptional activator regulatory domain-containing protein n=1 Tax=Penicillium angulare TaxID=116970 RepID=A0A9W9K033_9EURO|nr:hypothetical protein N7456_010798 [Penicillium angulare]
MNCLSRETLRWLENNLSTICPDFDLSQGPKLDAKFMETLSPSQDDPTLLNINSRPQEYASEPPITHDEVTVEEGLTNKRSHSVMESDTNSPLSAQARSVAIDLGMLSLQSDSRQRHYLGSSSGLLFAKLMGLENDSPLGQAAGQARRLNTQRISNEIYRSLYDKLRRELTVPQELPSPEEAGHLLEVYFQNIHLDHPFLHPASLINAYRALYMCTQVEYNGSLDKNGWVDSINTFSYNGKLDGTAGSISTPISISTAVFHVFMAFSLSATVLTRKKNYDYSPTRFQRMAMSTTSETLSNISVASLQAILLLTVQSLIEPAATNAWTLSHIAMSHCIDLGIHREPSDPDMSRAASAISRFIFYSVYSLDRSIATIQGRPLGIRDETFDTRLPDKADVAEMMALTDNDLTIQLPMPHLLGLSMSRFQLERHVSEIKLLLYHLPTRNQSFVWPTNHPEIQANIKTKLDQWLLSVQRMDPVPEGKDEEKVKFKFEKIRLEQLYHSAMTLLFQPSQMFPSPSQEALSICYQSCSKRLQIYEAVSNQDMLYYNWRNIHGIFSSGATIMYCAWVSRDLQQTIPFEKLIRDLRTCSNHLSIGSQWWPSVRSGKESFEMMIDLIIKHFSDMQLQIQDSNTSSPNKRRQISSRVKDHHSTPFYPTPSGMPRDLPETGISQSNYNQEQPHQFYSNDQDTQFGIINGNQPPLETMPVDPLHDLDQPTIEAAMENFMAEYLHDDWGWDPFSSSACMFENQGNGTF